nr:hypothetical protein [Tanacetum cinerariifolium]
MSSLFADTHNVVVILEKSDAAKDDVTRLQALVDRKKTVISKVVIREILKLDDAKGVVCLQNEEIFAGLAQMGYEKPSTKQTFYKAFFSSQWKFLINILLQSLNVKRNSWNKFSTAMASAVICLSKEQSLPPQQPQSSLQAPPQGAEFPTHFQHVLDTCSALTRRVKNLKHDKAAQKLEIIKLKARVKRLEKTNKVKSSKLRRLRKVRAFKRIESSDDMEDVFNQGMMIDDLDKDEGIELVVDQVKDADIAETEGRHAAEQAEKQAEIYHLDLDHSSKVLSKGILIETPKTMKKKDQIKLDAEFARKLHEEINKDHEEINKDIDWDAAIDHSREEMEEEDQEVLKSIIETQAQKVAKRRKLNEEAQEAEDLKKRLELILLVERRYLLSKFTLEQLVNVTRLQ